MEPGLRGLAAGPRDPGPGAGDRLRPGLPHGEVRGYDRTPRPSSRSVASTACASGLPIRRIFLSHKTATFAVILIKTW